MLLFLSFLSDRDVRDEVRGDGGASAGFWSTGSCCCRRRSRCCSGSCGRSTAGRAAADGVRPGGARSSPSCCRPTRASSGDDGRLRCWCLHAPPLVALLFGQAMDLSIASMMRLLALVVFVPRCARRSSRRCRRGRPGGWSRASTHSRSLLFAATNLGVFSQYSDFFFGNPGRCCSRRAPRFCWLGFTWWRGSRRPGAGSCRTSWRR